MKALVTGCAGFIGSHMTDRLIKEGYDVTGIDSFTDYYSAGIKESNVTGALKSDRFHLIRKDLLAIDSFPDTDLIFHMAAQPGVRSSWGQGFKAYVANNIEATQHLLEHYRGRKIKKLVYSSSSSVYGDTMTPMLESYVPRPVSPYGVTKLAAECLCHLYGKNYGMPVVSLRYFTVYGPRQRPDMAISKFFRAIAGGDRVVVYGDGEQTRDFTYVSDAIEANLLAARADAPDEIFNIGGGSRTTINGLIAVIEKICGRKALVTREAKQTGDAENTLANIDRAASLLGWSPKVPLEEGLKRYYEYTYPQAGR